MDKYEALMNIPVASEKVLATMMKIQAENGNQQVILNRYKVDEDYLRKLYQQEFLIPGMTVGVAIHAMSFISIAIAKHEEASTLLQCIRDNILAAGVYMTNVSAEKRAELEGRI
mgnify:CR=1 FL=1